MGPMKVQMRRYTLKEGAKEAFQRVFLETIVPLRQALGFRILGAYWLSEREFLWFVAHEDFEEEEKLHPSEATPRRGQGRGLAYRRRSTKRVSTASRYALGSTFCLSGWA